MNARDALLQAFEFHDIESADYLIEVIALEFGFTIDTIILIQTHYLNQKRYGELIKLCELHLPDVKTSIKTPQAKAYYNLALAQYNFGEYQSALQTLKRIQELNISIIGHNNVGTFTPSEAYYFQLFGLLSHKLDLKANIQYALGIAIKANPSLFTSVKLLAKVAPTKPVINNNFSLRAPSVASRTPAMSPIRHVPIVSTSPFLFGTPSPMGSRTPMVPRYNLRTPNSPDLFTTPVNIGTFDLNSPIEKPLYSPSLELGEDSELDMTIQKEIVLQEGLMKAISECLAFYEAQDVFSIVSADWPGSPTIIMLKALSFFKLGFPEQAMEIMNSMADFSWHQRHADIMLLIASAAEPNQSRMIANRLEKLLRGMNSSSSLDPKISSVIWFAQAIKYQGEQQVNSTIICLENSLQANKNPIVAFFYGCLLENINRSAEAATLLKSYIQDTDCAVKLLDLDKNLSLTFIRDLANKTESNPIKIKAVMKTLKRDNFFAERMLKQIIESEKRTLSRPYILATAYGLSAQLYELSKKRDLALNSIRQCINYAYPSQELITIFLSILSPTDDEFCVLLSLLDEARRIETERNMSVAQKTR